MYFTLMQFSLVQQRTKYMQANLKAHDNFSSLISPTKGNHVLSLTGITKMAKKVRQTT